MTQFIVNRDQSKALTEGASALLLQLSKFTHGPIVLALPGGRSTAPFLNALSELVTASDLELWSRVHIFLVDARLVPLNHPDSNFGLVRHSCASLIENKFISEAQLHPFVSEGLNEAAAITSYSEELRQFGGRFHITVVSSGEDGHIAGLFPNHPAMDAAGSFTTFHDSPKPPPDRMTATRSLIEKSDAVFILFLGEGKREALQKFKDRAISSAACPAKIVSVVPIAIVVSDLV